MRGIQRGLKQLFIFSAQSDPSKLKVIPWTFLRNVVNSATRSIKGGSDIKFILVALE